MLFEKGLAKLGSYRTAQPLLSETPKADRVRRLEEDAQDLARTLSALLLIARKSSTLSLSLDSLWDTTTQDCSELLSSVQILRTKSKDRALKQALLGLLKARETGLDALGFLSLLVRLFFRAKESLSEAELGKEEVLALGKECRERGGIP